MVSLLTVSRENYPALIKFLATFPHEIRNEDFWSERFNLWWDSNPALSDNLDRGWILEDNDKIVGFLGNSPSFFKVKDRTLTTFNLTTWRVLTEYRTHSLKLPFLQSKLAKDWILFITTPNEKTFRVINTIFRRKLILIPQASSSRNIMILNTQDNGKAKIKKILTKLNLSVPDESLMNVNNNATRQKTEFKSQFLVKNLATTDKQFDDLWEKTKHQFDYTNVRTGENIGWYCFASKFNRKILLGSYQHDQLMGYAISMVEIKENVKIWYTLDLWFDMKKLEVMDSLVKAIINQAITQNCELIIFPILPKELSTVMKQYDFIEEVKEHQRKDFMTGLEDIILNINPANSYFTDAQGDKGL